MMDINTLVIVLCCVFFISALMVVFSYLQNKQIDGPLEWTIGLISLSAGIFLIFARGHIPLIFSVLFGNALLQLGSAMLLLGVQAFCDKKPNYKLITIFFILTWLPFWFLYDIPESMHDRIHLSDFAHTILQISAGLILLKKFRQTKSSAVALTAFGFLISGGNTVFRSLSFILSDSAITTPLNPSVANSYFFLVLIISHIIIALGFSMLIAEELRNRLQSSLKTEKQARSEQNNFWAMVSHEFKTPLGTIQNSSQLIEKLSTEEKDNHIQDAVERIQRATQRLSKLVSNTIHDHWVSANVSDSDSAINQSKFDLQSLLQRLCFEYNIPFAFNQTSNQAIVVHGDQDLFATAISSLIDNALKYGTDPAKVTLTLSTAQNKHVVIDVYNAGDPIPTDEREKIFEKFYSSPRHSNIPGSGLGLYNTQKIVSLHNGNIEIINNNGTIFRVTQKLV